MVFQGRMFAGDGDKVAVVTLQTSPMSGTRETPMAKRPHQPTPPTDVDQGAAFHTTAHRRHPSQRGSRHWMLKVRDSCQKLQTVDETARQALGSRRKGAGLPRRGSRGPGAD
ncbi:hypothetical protein TTRE_0000201101 [Trichuris trichiura]|uniref:Uncharacterized protein n=1 Tax=Trichuris trichiura TaxID=36087 RepID=A0A077Z1E3_TRITR|nr:hypothetical protein TTRE_0000201101 [Trichuris trichiura]